MRKLAALLLFAQLSLSDAQTATDTTKDGLAVLPTPDGAVLRWYLPDNMLPAGGFVVQVTDKGTVRSVPVASPQPYSPALGLTQAQYDGLKAIYTGRALDNDTMNARAFVTLGVLSRPELARALGILTTLKGLSSGSHTATVYAVGPSGRTLIGTAKFLTGPSPSVPPPGKLNVTGGQPSAQLTWEPSPGGEDSLVVAYNVYRALEGGAFSRVTPEPFVVSTGEAGSFADTGLKTDATYRYQVTSIDLFGRESLPSAVATLTAKENTPLQVPEISQAVAGDRVITLDWPAITDARVKSLTVLRGTDPNALTAIVRLPPTATHYEDRTVDGGVGYLYALSTADGSGRGTGRGQLASATAVNLTLPITPRNVTVKSGEDALTIAWTANPEKDVLGYLVYRSQGDQAGSQEMRLTGSPIMQNNYQDTIPKGVQIPYHYRIVAVNTSQIESAPSAPVTAALLDRTPPPVPVIAAATIDQTGVVLSWDGAEVPDLQGFELIRSQAGGTVTVLQTAAAQARTFTDTSARPGMKYEYSLRSVDAAGNKSDPAEAISVVVPQTTKIVPPNGPQATLLPDGQGVKLDWVSVDVDSAYVVYRFFGAQAIQVSDLIKDVTFIDVTGQADSRYQVRTVSSAGDLSDPTVTFGPTR